MNPSQQDDAALYALGLMDPAESRAFEQLLRTDPELARFVDELRDTTAGLAQTVPACTPPPALKARIMAEIGDQSQIRPLSRISPPAKKAKFAVWNALGWGIAAALTVCSAFLGDELQRSRRLTVGLQKELQQSQAESDAVSRVLAQLREQNNLSKMEIATLRSSLADYQQGVAVVVWNSDKREGVLKLEKMPPLDPLKDYQLWVVETDNPVPVDAGVVKVDQQGFAQIDFKPVVPVTEATKFALSVERKGGVPRGEGPIVLIGP